MDAHTQLDLTPGLPLLEIIGERDGVWLISIPVSTDFGRTVMGLANQEIMDFKFPRKDSNGQAE